MVLQIAREVVTACDYNRQLSTSGRTFTAIVTPSLLHSKVADLPAGFRCPCYHNCFKAGGLIAEQFTIVCGCLRASCGFSGVGSGLWQRVVLRRGCEPQPESHSILGRSEEAGHCRHPPPAAAFWLCWTEKIVVINDICIKSVSV